MSLDLVIGHKGEDHVTSSDFARLLKLIVGPTKNYGNSNDCLILRNPELSALIADNTITLSLVGGYYSICGRFAYSLNTTTLTVPGVVTSGNKRKDAIIVEFNRVNNIESVEYKVIQGSETSSTPVLPTLPYDTGNPEVNATYQMLIGALNIDGSSVSCEPLETYGANGRPWVNRVRSLWDSYWNYIMMLPEVSIKNSSLKLGSSGNSTLFSLLKSVTILTDRMSNNDVRIIVSLDFVDYLGDVYTFFGGWNFTVEIGSYYLAEVDVTLDLNKYFAHHEQKQASNDFPFSASAVLLKPKSAQLFRRYRDTTFRNREINTAVSNPSIMELGKALHASNTNGLLTLKIPAVYFYVDRLSYPLTIYSLSNPDSFREELVHTSVEYMDFNSTYTRTIPGDIISVIDIDTQLPVEYTKTYDESYSGWVCTVVNPVSGHTIRVSYYPIDNDSQITEVVQPSA